MNLQEFIDKRDVEYCKNLIKTDDVPRLEEETGVHFGQELRQYVLQYGYLAYKYIELYGVNSIQMMDSDMIKQTVYLHKCFPKNKYYIALENIGDGDYAVVNSNDDVFEYCSAENSLQKTGMKLFGYIADRFRTADEMQEENGK